MIPIIMAKISSPPESEIDLAHAKFIILNMTYPMRILAAEHTIHWKTDTGSEEVLVWSGVPGDIGWRQSK